MDMPQSPAQNHFNMRYISSVEICERLRINRSTITNALKRKKLPGPIRINGVNIHLWEREQVEPFLEAWETARKFNQGMAV